MKGIIQAYDRYKNRFLSEMQYPIGIIGIIIGHLIRFIYNHFCLDYKFKTKLKYVRIFFDTPTFDTIVKVNK